MTVKQKDSIISAANLIVDYQVNDTVRAIDGINISIEQGELIAIIGRNGSGKSTLAKCFNALVIPTEGTVKVKDMDTCVTEYVPQIRQTVGMLFQNPDNQIVAAIVEDDIAFGPENLAVSPEYIEKCVIRSAQAVNMRQYLKHPVHNLSGGQKQKAAIAGIIAMNPECIIFDEATSMLDAKGRKAILDIALKLNRENNITVIYITHNMEEAAYAKRVLVMKDGKIVMDSSPQQVFSDEEHLRDMGLAVPSIMQLSYALNKKGMPVPTGIFEADKLSQYICNSILHAPSKKDTHACRLNEMSCDYSQNEPVIKFENVSHVYMKGTPFEKKAIYDINLTIYEGEYVAIVGNTGSGKSTLIQHINGMLLPTSGNVYVNGIQIRKDNKLKNIRKKVGVVFQFPEHQLFEETVYKDIAFGPKQMGLTPREIHERVLEAINLVGLENTILERSPFQLSGGEKRRVAIAGVVALNTEILVFDEPTVGIDPEGREQILKMIYDLKRKKNLTIILVTHNTENAAKYINRIVVLRDGRIHRIGTPYDIYKIAYTDDIDLTIPPIHKVMMNLHNFYPPVNDNIYTVSEAADEILKHTDKVLL